MRLAQHRLPLWWNGERAPDYPNDVAESDSARIWLATGCFQASRSWRRSARQRAGEMPWRNGLLTAQTPSHFLG